MNADGTANSQVVDAVISGATLVTGLSPSQAHGMLDAVLVETLGMVMYSAVSRQQGAGMISSAATTAACAKMLAAPFPIIPAPPPSAPPPTVNPVPGPAPTPPQPAALIANSTNEAKAALTLLKDQLDRSTANVQLARNDLEQLAKIAQVSPATPNPTSTPSASGSSTPAVKSGTAALPPATSAGGETASAKPASQSPKPVLPATPATGSTGNE